MSAQEPADPRPTTQVDDWGIQATWVDADEGEHTIDDATIAELRRVIGNPPDDLEQRAPVVTRPGRRTGLAGVVRLEDGGEWRLADVVPDDLPLGYHRLVPDDGAPERAFIVSPGRCVLPETQTWGWAAQVYATWSRGSQGIGDLADLATLRAATEQAGGGFVMVNPLMAVAPVTPLETSPYLPATRRFLNPLYLRVPGLDAEPLGQTIDRDAVWARKLGALQQTFERFLDSGGDPAFDDWRAAKGEQLEEFAGWCVLAERHGADFRSWPEPLRDPRTDAVRDELTAAADRVRFHAWLQWQSEQQVTEARGDSILVQDLPVGVSGGGADSWSWQGLVALGVTVGAPPDQLNTQGQDWGSPPLVPWRLRLADYAPIIESLRASLALGGGLRVDHVLGLFRLWWVPEGASPTAGGYVHYPADDLLDIVCLESHRAGAWVVGEDLGTVPDGVREAMAERDILGYRVLWFEDDDPADWSAEVMATVTTHDLPTVAGVWTGSDADDQKQHTGMDPDEIDASTAAFKQLLRRDGLGADAGIDEAVTAAYRQLGAAPSLMRCLSLDDASGAERRPNIPGTTERPNWCLPLPMPLEELLDSPLFASLPDNLG